jgi:hypothetical protein
MWVAVVLKPVDTMPEFVCDLMNGTYSWMMGANDANGALINSTSSSTTGGAAYAAAMQFDQPFPADLSNMVWLETDVVPRIALRAA